MIVYFVEQFDHDSTHIVAAFRNEDDAISAVDKFQKEDEIEEQRYREWAMKDDDENDYDGDAIFGYSYHYKSIEVK